MMGLIFFFSAQPKGSPLLEGFPLPAGLGHFIGYLLLGILLYRAFNNGLAGWSLRAGGYSFLTGLIYAISDELHQLYVPGRECSVSDIVIDGGALVFALVVIWAWNSRFNKYNSK